ncbi:MAG: helix-turn-helix transcriptional regulator [Pseudonocardiales bacterium]|nr:helix-turn-helix transcriptional regulator [Pseudonocardiales bacterium]
MGSGDDDLIVRLVGNTPPVHPALLARPDVRVALAGHDIGAVFRVLNEHGWSQRGIARAVGMRQSEVTEILKGRRVIGYRVLVRIADGLGIPRVMMNLGPADGGGAYAGGVTGAEPGEEVDAEMRRRALLAAATIAVVRPPAARAEELAEPPAPKPVPPPSRLLGVHVVKVRDLTQKLRETSRTHGSDPQVSSATAGWATGLLQASGPEPVRRALLTAVAELHSQAGYAAFDAGLHDRAIYHCTRALQLAYEAGDAYLQTLAMTYAGMFTVEHGRPNDGLKLLQLAWVKAGHIPADDQRERIVFQGSRAVLRACTRADSATALARMGDPDGAAAKLAEARELWQPTPADPSGDLDYVAARLELERGRLEAAEPLATASVRRWDAGHSQRARAFSSVVLATIHVRAGEADGLRLAHGAITDVDRLSSVRARRRLDPLASALDARPGGDHRQLARMARDVATTRA